MLLDPKLNRVKLLSSPTGKARRAALRRLAVAAARRPGVETLEGRVLFAGYLQTNLAADQPGTALVHDPELIDAQGIAINPTGTFWLSARATDVSTVYSGDVTQPDGSLSPFVKSALTVKIPGGAPTGQVFNGSGDFVVSSGPFSAPARFVFASETGHITGWNAAVPPPPPSRDAQLKASTPGAVYTGLAIGNNGSGNFLYAADFENGKIDVFDRTYTPTTLAGSFADPTIPNAYSPINIQNLGGKLYVAYARQDGDGDGLPGNGAGFVSVFDTNGNFLNRLVSGGHLHAPWGMAVAPANFGEFSNALLVASTGDGRVDAFDPATGSFLGQLRDPAGAPVTIDGLWGLDVGNGTVSGDRNALYFTAAPDDHQHGLFGSLRVVPDARAAQTQETVHGSWRRRGLSGGDSLTSADELFSAKSVSEDDVLDRRSASVLA
jgi:uncharacterized protein (TIGR03118 family)